MTNLSPARTVAPGRIISRELEARGWTQKDLAEIMNRPPQTINEIIRGTKQITPETAIALAAAFGTSCDFWANLETNYRLNLAKKNKNDDAILRRSRLYSLAPISELIKRQWIQPTNSIDELEKALWNFLGIISPEEIPQLSVNFRHSQKQTPEINAQMIWMKRVEHLIKEQKLGEFNRTKLTFSIPEILSCALKEEDVRQVPHLLLDLGVHFIIVPHLSKTYLDGAAFYLDNNPVVALTLRYDRIDSFWFTLMHELSHIVLGHQGIYLDDLNQLEVNDEENEANQLACNWLISPENLEASIIAMTSKKSSTTPGYL